MDFDEAIALHSKWKHNLRTYLAKRDGTLNPADVAFDDRCTLGRWIYSDGAAYSALPEYVRLKYQHARLHILAAEMVRKANAGESVASQADPCAGSEFSIASSAVVIALAEMKKQVESPPPVLT
jgi:Chemoreceptor zinc-binding domain